MKTRLNITVEEGLLTAMKAYAMRKQKSVSELVELYCAVVGVFHQQLN
jgi:hypothetical protein